MIRQLSLLPLLCASIVLPLFSQPLNVELFEGMKARNIGPAGMSGRVTAIDVVLSKPDHIYIGTASGGMWHSQNGGTNWQPLFQEEGAMSVGALVLNQSNPNEIWIGTGEGNPRNSLSSGNGVYRSIDGGKTWQHMGLEKTRNIHRLIMHPQDPKTLWAGVIGSPWSEHPERGVYKTTDGGKTWQKVLYANEGTGIADLILDPNNPNKLIAAMWEHRRHPWFFNSGGPNSGIFISYDGGENWKKVDADKGLPKGDLGRIGLSFAPSRPNLVYALMESKKNGLYKSTDGGESWSLVATKNIGGRPFYYADIFVDTKNENRIYNVHTMVDVSQDGGKTFERFIPTQYIHVDNHAWWQHPEDSEFLICGNDGGLCLTRDGGKTWDFPENVPIGQFYHIRVDDAIPYNVYGGMQDNGSWRGPSQVWRRKGIRNLYWNRIGYGDGFDCLPDPKNPRFGYSMLQGGSLLRYDLETGAIQGLKPFLEDGTPLRFNWNPGMALDPFEQEIVYLGSQFLLKSMDQGNSWEKISPDLTTNDPEKQKQTTSGGLTFDATGAENFTTILTIAPSTLEKGLIWVGTDDGKVQITRDGGQNWVNVTQNIKGVPAGSWVAQIQASTHSAAEAFVVINNYRRGDWKPYLFYTQDYGKTWKNLAQLGEEVYCHSVVQDPLAANLLFLGTEFGLRVSLDKGKTWAKWTNGYPTVSTTDLALQAREHDLVLGTFGRAIWILDDIRPLRELAQAGQQAILDKSLHLFPIPHAYLNHLGEPNGYRSTGHGIFMGENRPQGALLSYYIKELQEAEQGKKTEQVNITIFDSSGKKVRNFKKKAKKGLNRINWGLEQKGIRFPNQKKNKKGIEPRGCKVVPGVYTVQVSYGDTEVSGSVEVIPDPKIPVSKAEMKEKSELINEFYDLVGSVTQQIDSLKALEASIDLVNKRIGEMGESEQLKALKLEGDSLKKEIKRLIALVNIPEEIQGIYINPAHLITSINFMRRALQDILFPVTATQRYQLQDLKQKTKPILKEIEAFKTEKWTNYKQRVYKSRVRII